MFLYGEPVAIPRKLSPEEAERYRSLIETTLNDLCERGEREFDSLWGTGKKGEEKRK